MTDPAATPIVVKASAAPVVMSESFKVIVVAGLAAVADHFMKSETALVAVVAAGGAVATVCWGVYQRLRTWRALKALANAVEDSVAVLK